MSPNLYHLARLLAPGADRSLGRGARDLASAGVSVFPCVPGEKRPLTKRGFHDAGTNPEQVSAWWRRWAAADPAIPPRPSDAGSIGALELVEAAGALERAIEHGEPGDPGVGAGLDAIEARIAAIVEAARALA